MMKPIKIELRYYKKGKFFTPNRAKDFSQLLALGWEEGFIFSNPFEERKNMIRIEKLFDFLRKRKEDFIVFVLSKKGDYIATF